MGKKYTTDEIEVGGHMLDALMMSGLNTIVSAGDHAGLYAAASHNHAQYIVEGGTAFSGVYPMVVRVGATSYYSDQDITFAGASSQLYVGGSIKTPILYDSNNTGYYVNPASTSVQAIIQAEYIGAGGVAYTSGSYRLNMGGSIRMNNSNIDYLSQLHFNSNVRFYQDSNDSYLNFKYGDAATGGIKFLNGGGTQKGYVYASDSGFGLLDNDGSWAVKTQTGTSPLELRCDNNTEFQVYNSYTVSPGSSRAPVFYDSNNTSYYIDPSTTGDSININGAINLKSSHTGGNIKMHYDYGGSDQYNGNMVIFMSEPGVTHDGGGIGANIDGKSPHYGRAINHGYGVYLRFAKTDGTFEFWTTSATAGASGGRGTKRFWGDVAGNTFSQSSSRAPIFYDSNNTGYYSNPGSTSNLNIVNSPGGVTFTNYGIGVTGTYSSNRLQTIFNMGASYKISSGGDAVNNAYGLYWSHQNAGTLGGANNLASHGLIILEGGTYKGSWGGGRLVTTGDVRAPIFYDSNNTSYYLDPASTSKLNHGYFYSTLSFGSFNPGVQGTQFEGYGTHSVIRTDSARLDFYMAKSSTGVGTSMTITDTGRVGIGTTNPTTTLDVQGSIFTRGGLYFTPNGSTSSIPTWGMVLNGAGDLVIDDTVGPRNVIFSNAGNVGIGTVSPSQKLHVAGAGIFTSTVTATNFILSSDRRLKTKITDLSCDNIDVNWKSFEMTSSEGEYRTGVIAQELERKHPEFVNTDNEGFKSVKYIDLLIAKIAELEARLEKLEK